MAHTQDVQVVVAFPRDEAERDKIRLVIGLIPAIVPGAVDMPCEACDLVLAVGPRSAAVVRSGAVLVCPQCAVLVVQPGDEFEVKNLGNPDSRPETKQ